MTFFRYHYPECPSFGGSEPAMWTHQCSFKDPRPEPSLSGHPTFGWVEYERELTLKEVAVYKLWPDDEMARAELVFYRAQGGLRRELVAMPAEDLEEMCDGSDRMAAMYAAAALILKRANDQPREET